MSKLPLVSIVIPAHNEEEHIRKALLAIEASDYPKENLEIIVVDHASTDNTFNIAKEFSDKVLTLEGGNVGSVRNFGAQASFGEIIIFLDADCICDTRWITRSVNLISNSKNHVFGGSYKVRKNANWIERLWLLDNPKHPRLQPDLLGGCIIIPKETFNRVGGFNERMTSGEDSDLSDKLRSTGYTVKILQELSVIHLGNPRTIKDFFKRQVWHSENYITFIKKSLLDLTFWLCITFSLLIILAITNFITRNPSLSAFYLSLSVAIALTLSAKRLYITKYRPKSILEAIGILTLDFTYLVARTVGIIKSTIKLIKN